MIVKLKLCQFKQVEQQSADAPHGNQIRKRVQEEQLAEHVVSEKRRLLAKLWMRHNGFENVEIIKQQQLLRLITAQIHFLLLQTFYQLLLNHRILHNKCVDVFGVRVLRQIIVEYCVYTLLKFKARLRFSKWQRTI